MPRFEESPVLRYARRPMDRRTIERTSHVDLTPFAIAADAATAVAGACNAAR